MQFKNDSKAIISIITVISLSCFGISSCMTREIKNDTEITEEISKVISHVTSGTIPPNSQIIVRFVSPVIEKSNVGDEIDVLTFSPSIKGKSIWKDERTISFIPETSSMVLNTVYQANLNLSNIPNNNNLKTFDFSFKTIRREVANIESDFTLVNQNKPDEVIYQGEINFNTPTSIDVFKNAISFKVDDNELPLEITDNNDKNKFTFKSKSIRRDKYSKRMVLSIDKGTIGLSDNYVKNDTLESIETMKVSKVENIEQEKDLGLEIKFTDQISDEQDINGFVKIEPPLDIKLRQDGDKVRVTGDFKYGKKYTLKVNQGVKSRWGTSAKDEYSKDISFDDIKPQVSFANDGVFLTSSSKQKLYFKTVNVSSVRVTVKKVYESNTGIFLQSERLYSPKNRTDYFDEYNIERVGKTVYEKDLEIGDKKNQWLQNEMDISKLIKPTEKGFFLVTLSFTKENMLYNFSTDKNRVYDGDDYYNYPNSEGYISTFASTHKAVILSDIGLTYKKGYKQNIVYATDVISALPKGEVNIILKNYQNQVIAVKQTDNEGKAVFDDIDQEVFYVEGEKDGQKSIVVPTEMTWNLSTFNTEGAETEDDGTKAFIYTERGVYRPGDTINISVIARNENGTFPDNYPMNLKIYNPKQQVVFEQNQKEAKEGFYNFAFNTSENDLTGNWSIEASTGNKTFNQMLKIETVIPNRLKIKLDSPKEEWTNTDTAINFKVISNYLFGNPASDLEAEVSGTLKSINKTLPKFPNYIFTNEAIDYKEFTENIFTGKLNSNGEKQIKWELPKLNKAPSLIEATIDTRVIEKGGRDTQNRNSYIINPYEYYVGIQKPDLNYLKSGEEINIKTILTDADGKIFPERKLKYTVYKNNRNWWWEYDNQNDFRLHYKSDNETQVIKTGEKDSKSEPINISFKPETTGEYFVEVTDISNRKNSGHTAGLFFSSSYWATSNSKDDGVLALKTDKEKYNVKDKAIITFPNPEHSNCLISVERGNKVLNSYWYSSKDKTAKIEIPITDNMLPTSYISVSVIQPHAQTENDRPIRMYGVVPINVENKETRQEITLNVPKEIKAKKPFTVQIQTKDNKPTQFTLAVVDEGLLDLTNFKTPDPWDSFYQKLRLGVSTHDLFAYVIGVNKGDVFKTFSVGGDLDYRINQQEMKKAKRFKLVSLFQKPTMTDAKGFAQVTFNMPEYLGSVRVMAMSATGNRFGSVEKSIPVKSDLIMLPTIPRVLAPNDSIVLPVSVFSTKNDIKNTEIKLSTEGGLMINGPSSKNLYFEKAGDKDIFFNLTAGNTSGIAKLNLIGKYNSNTDTLVENNQTEINIRPASPRVNFNENKTGSKGQNFVFTIPSKGIKDSNKSVLTVSRKPKLNLSNRLEYLTNYPYGCVEQVISAVFPQLFLKDFVQTTDKGDKSLDNKINDAIKSLRKFQLGNGSFAYWSGQPEGSVWGTNYAGHFLIEAQKKGYYVPDEMISNWFKYQNNQSLSTSDLILSRVYRVYLLALGGQPEFGAMNLLKENDLKKMNDTQKWLLAGAYKLSGMDSVATQIISKAGFSVNTYNDKINETYGSGLRDKSIILDMLNLFKNPKANDLYNEITEELSTDTWYSTQTIGYSLMALGKYMENNQADFRGKNLSGYYINPEGKKVSFKSDKVKVSFDMPKGFEGKKVEVFLDNNNDVENTYLSLESSYVPLYPEMTNISKNLTLNVDYLDENGKRIEVGNLKQGTTFWSHFSIANNSGIDLKEIALTQVLPSGWEIENTRLSEDDLPVWTANYRLNLEDYQDIRDDRVMWFFDINANDKPVDFMVKMSAVTQGKFTLPNTLAETMYSNNYIAKKSGRKVIVSN